MGRRLRNLTDIDKFDKDVFMSGTIKPLVQDLINEIKEAMHVEPVLQAFGVPETYLIVLKNYLVTVKQKLLNYLNTMELL